MHSKIINQLGRMAFAASLLLANGCAPKEAQKIDPGEARLNEEVRKMGIQQRAVYAADRYAATNSDLSNYICTVGNMDARASLFRGDEMKLIEVSFSEKIYLTNVLEGNLPDLPKQAILPGHMYTWQDGESESRENRTADKIYHLCVNYALTHKPFADALQDMVNLTLNTNSSPPDLGRYIDDGAALNLP